MRKHTCFCLLFAMFFLAACNEQPEIELMNKGELVLTARTECPTKTVVTDETNVYWEPGDAIAVFSGDSSGRFVTDLSEPAPTATFKGSLVNKNGSGMLWALYPYDKDASFDGECITTVLPSTQIARANSFGKDMNLSVARTAGNTLQFYNVGGGVCFTVKEEGIKKVMFEGLDGEIISGTVRIGFDENGVPEVREVTGGSQFITLLPPEGETFQTGTWYYIVAIPGTLEKGYRFHFYKENSFGPKVAINNVAIKRSIYGSVNAVDEQVEYISYQAVETTVESICNTLEEYVSISDETNAQNLLEQKKAEIESNPIVESVTINDVASNITLIDGRQIVFPFDYPSAFDDDDDEEEIDADSQETSIRSLATKQVLTDKSTEVLNADVVIFNLFSEDSRRKNQNKMVEATQQLLEDAGYRVCYCGYDDFTSTNVDFAIARGKMIFFSTLGNEDGSRICIGEIIDSYIDKALNYTFVYSYKKEKKYKRDYHVWIDVKKLLSNYYGPLVYFASCNTLKNTFPERLNIIGWDGINRAGQAYGLIIADYIARHKHFDAFKFDFLGSDGIVDPIETGTHLVYSKTASYWDWNNLSTIHGTSPFDKTGWNEVSRESELCIDSPHTGSCVNDIRLRTWRSTNYNIEMTFKNSHRYVTDGKTTTFGDYKYSVTLNELSERIPGADYVVTSANSGPLRFKNNKATYAYDGFKAGLWRIETYATNTLTLHSEVTDCSYVLFSHKFKKNDGEYYESMPAPDVVTLKAEMETDGMFLAGAVINRDRNGLETGFKYYKLTPEDKQNTLSHNDSLVLVLRNGKSILSSGAYEEYFGALVKEETFDGDYIVMAYATDESGRTSYGDMLTCQTGANSGPVAVDLGLPSGIKWASFNVGASRPEDPGDFFAWGETEPKQVYSWSTYKWCEGSANTLTKYNTLSSRGFVDNKTILELDDDVAHVRWGGSWRMPTKEEYNELFENCTWSLLDQNDESVIVLTSKINAETLIIPEYGCFWHSTIDFQNKDGSNDWRYIKYCVRPVTDEGVRIPVTGVSMKRKELTLTLKAMSPIPVIVSPSNATQPAIIWSSSNLDVATVDINGTVKAVSPGKTTITATTYDGGYSATMELTVVNGYAQPEAVDLGLPSGVKWASFNVGATKPEEYGNFYAWGETEPKDNYEYSNFKWINSDKYNAPYSSLDREDDAAAVNLGGVWRMPTSNEVSELKTNCNWTWTQKNGINGYLVESKKNNNSIFLPASGVRINNQFKDYEVSGTYLCSDRAHHDSAIHCLELHFDENDYYPNAIHGGSSSSGITIRAVCE